MASLTDGLLQRSEMALYAAGTALTVCVLLPGIFFAISLRVRTRRQHAIVIDQGAGWHPG